MDKWLQISVFLLLFHSDVQINRGFIKKWNIPISAGEGDI